MISVEEKINLHKLPNRTLTKLEWLEMMKISKEHRFKQGELIKGKYFIKYCESCFDGIRAVDKQNYKNYLIRIRKYVIDNAKRNSEYARKRYLANLEEERLKRREYMEKNKDKVLKYRSTEEYKKRVNSYTKNRRDTDPSYRIGIILRNRLRRLTDKLFHPRASERESAAFLVWLAKKQNVKISKEYHVDHIVPCKAFNLLDPAQAAFCNSPYNLRWLTAKENYKKNRKMPTQDEIESHKALVEEWELNYPLLKSHSQDQIHNQHKALPQTCGDYLGLALELASSLEFSLTKNDNLFQFGNVFHLLL